MKSYKQFLNETKLSYYVIRYSGDNNELAIIKADPNISLEDQIEFDTLSDTIEGEFKSYKQAAKFKKKLKK